MTASAQTAHSALLRDRYPESEIPLPRLRTICHLWTCAAVLAALGVASLAIDTPLAAWAQAGNCPGFIRKICGLGEVFGHGLGVVGIAVIIAVLDPWHRYAIPRILAAGLGSGLAANGLKLFVARTRPHHFDLQARGLESFVDGFPLLSNASWDQSFPSAHAATAAGLAIVLACYYPRGRWLFPVLAALAGAQRVLEQSHFLSDVFWGAAVGCIVAPLCVYGSRLSIFFDRLEQRLLEQSGMRARTRARTAQARKTAAA
jgi:membrane-associated phospholipid phosphatase